MIDNINVLELIPILDGARRWGPGWINRRICIVTDNTQVLHAVRTGRSRNKHSMSMLRDLFWLCAEFNFYLEVVYINTKLNKLCDNLSRLDEPDSAENIRNLMSEGSMCCFHLFGRDGPAEDRGSTTDGHALRPSISRNEGDAAKQVSQVLQRVRSGPAPMYQRACGTIHSLDGPDYESLVNQGLFVGVKPSLEGSGVRAYQLQELQSPHGHRGGKEEAGNGGETGLSTAAEADPADVRTSYVEPGSRGVPGGTADIVPGSVAKTECDIVGCGAASAGYPIHSMGDDASHPWIKDYTIRGSSSPYTSSESGRYRPVCSLLGEETLHGYTSSTDFAGVSGRQG